MFDLSIQIRSLLCGIDDPLTASKILAAESAGKKAAAEMAVVGRIKKARAPIKANDRSQRGLPRSERKG